ncbi:FKBP-type peptidyl-prolyl cis-trans isomerase [Marinifilum sp.]|uniref:FKBP-type peptidyl-prolyl cis-trans isomerase n=1 Tax=Marinifilum sp. TaxID=2033137 RepID=UPI003BACB002
MKYRLLAVMLAFIVASCSSDGDKDYRQENEAEIKAYIADNNLNAERSTSGLYYVIEEQGTGIEINGYSNVTVSYKGHFTNGVEFDNTGDDFTSFNLQEVLPGFVEGLTYINEGGSIILLVPAHLGYGSNDANGIPGGSVLVFEVTVYSPEMIAEKNDEDIAAYIEAEGLDATKTESGLYYVVNQEGKGAQPTADSDVRVAYTGYFLDGTKFDESGASGLEFNLSQVIEGWKEGITYFKEGGKGKIIVPAHLAYGTYNYDRIPGGSVLVFDIELIEVKE